METKLTLAALLALILIWSHQADAGMFLDLGIGTHLGTYHEHKEFNIPRDKYLGHENPLGIVRLGYQTKAYKVYKSIDIRGQIYLEHISSIPIAADSGVDMGVIGVRFE